MGFLSVPKPMTLSDLERPNGRHYAFIIDKYGNIRSQMRKIHWS